ncbi:autotransporter assembly complex protein TamA [Muricoccus vinaceus]|uniref:Autotransporter assembly complex family protein n=1 Tax=Muricoccus vinaceus TaxID=424704 RepID=A0ABV6IS19_9PROT
MLTLLPAVSSRGEEAHRRVAPGQERAVDPGAANEVGADLLLYQVQIAPTGDAALDDALSAVSRLIQLREEAPTTAFGLVARAADDRERLARALHSEGYWGGSIQILLGSLALSTSELVERLEKGQERPVMVRIRTEPGPRYTLSSIVVSASTQDGMAPVAAVTEEDIGLSPGDPAAAAPVLAAEERLVRRLLAAGYPLASVVRRNTVVDYDRRSMEVAWTLALGPQASFGAPQVAGTERVDPGFLVSFAANQLAGETYSPERLEQARKRIMALGAFASVRSEPGERLDRAGQLPVTFNVTERPRHAIGITAAYETNYGPSVQVYWEHRNLFGSAERLRLEAEVARLGSGALVDGSTYRAFATLGVPGLFGRDLTLVTTAGALRERLRAYDRDAGVASAILEQRVSDHLTFGIGPTLDIGESGLPGGPLRPYQIAGVALTGRWDGTDSLLNPTKGWRVNGRLTPGWSFRETAPFTPLRVTVSTYQDMLGDGRSILALRGSFGTLVGSDRLDVPQHQRFFAGGGGSVRGYDYQSIGPRDAQGRPLGGASLLEASVEWRQRIGESWGGVAFVDAGTVGTGTFPDTSSLRAGAGFGVRYHTVIGPIRADVALPLVRQVGSSGYGIYVGIGQAF